MVPSSTYTSTHASNQKNNVTPPHSTDDLSPIHLYCYQFHPNSQQKVSTVPKDTHQIGKNPSLSD